MPWLPWPDSDHFFHEGLAGADAEHAVFVQVRVTLDREDVVALAFLDGLFQRSLGTWLTGSWPNRLAVFRLRRSDQRLPQRQTAIVGGHLGVDQDGQIRELIGDEAQQCGVLETAA